MEGPWKIVIPYTSQGWPWEHVRAVLGVSLGEVLK